MKLFEALASFVKFVLAVIVNYILCLLPLPLPLPPLVNEMGRPPCCDKSNVKRGLWTAEEDAKILAHVSMHGTGNWTSVPKKAGLKRCGKSCRLRWTNYLRPDLKHENFTLQEEELIIKLHETLGSRWSLIAAQLPGRTDNDVKNFWNTKLRKKLFEIGIDPVTHKPFSQIFADYGKIGGLLNKSTARFGSLNRDLPNAFIPKSEPISHDPISNYSSMTTTTGIRPKMEPIQDIPLNNNNNSWELLAQLHAIQPYLMHEVGGSSSSSSSVSSNFTQISSPPPPSQNQTFMNQITPSSPIFSWSEFLLDQDVVLPNQQEENFDWFQSSPGSVSINGPKNNEIKINEDLGQDYGGSTSMVRSGSGGTHEFTALGITSSSLTTTTTTSGNSFIEGILDQESELHMWEFPNLFDESSY